MIFTFAITQEEKGVKDNGKFDTREIYTTSHFWLTILWKDFKLVKLLITKRKMIMLH